MQPIATPDETIDSTIGSSAVAGGQVEGAVLERIGFDHHDFVVWIAVMLSRGKRDVAIDAWEFLELIEIADDLLRLGADALHRLGDHPWAVIAERDPPQQRVTHVDFGALETVNEGEGAFRKLAAWAITNVAEIVGIDLRPVFGLFQQGLGLTRAKRGLADDRHVPFHLPTRVDDAGKKARIHAPGHDRLGSCGAHTQKFWLKIRIGGVDVALIDDLGAFGLEHWDIGIDRGGAIAGSIADNRDLF